MRITAIEPQRRARDRFDISVDGVLRCACAADVLLRASLAVGDEVEEAALVALERADAEWRAREAALSLLAVRARSREELRRRLARKAFEPEAIERSLDGLDRAGLLDDAAFAAAFVRDRVRFKPRGAQRLRQELRARGVSGDVAGEAIAEVLGAEASEAELALAVATSWDRRNPARATEDALARTRRLYGFLARRGFAADAVREAIAAVLRDD